MSTIIKKDNVYVLIDSNNVNVEDDSATVILNSEKNNSTLLYGGRVKVRTTALYNYGTPYNQSHYLQIDGIHICWATPNFNNDLGMETITAYLNQIENLGADTFLNNYKKAIENFKQELSSQAERLEHKLSICEDEDIQKRLKSITDIIYKLTFVLLNLAINMNAGLDNSVYEAAYQSVINLCQ